ncbi:MAG: MBL fold metallo-hydrolase [Bacilli bacterium]|nr:MBL fold metallo-hydrolase [Bacilli bacterium]
MINVNTQSSIKIDNIYFDPYQIEKETNDAKIIFITHPHYDHFDINSIKKIENKDTVFVIPDDENIKENLNNRKIFVINPNKEYKIQNIRFKTVPAYNIDKTFHKKEYNWVGYVVYLDKTYYIMGDTDSTKEAEGIKCDHLFIPIGGTYTMNYKEAAQLTNIIKPKIVTPIHYGKVVGKKEYGEKFKKLINEDIKVELLIDFKTINE